MKNIFINIIHWVAETFKCAFHEHHWVYDDNHLTRHCDTCGAFEISPDDKITEQSHHPYHWFRIKNGC